MGLKSKLKNIGKLVLGGASLVGVPGASTIDKAFGLLETKGMTPETKAELLRLKTENKHELERIESERDTKIAESAAGIIAAEARSQSWLPRNVRPLLLLIFGLAIAFNIFAPTIARFF